MVGRIISHQPRPPDLGSAWRTLGHDRRPSLPLPPAAAHGQEQLGRVEATLGLPFGVGRLLDAFPPHECANLVKNAGYRPT